MAAELAGLKQSVAMLQDENSGLRTQLDSEHSTKLVCGVHCRELHSFESMDTLGIVQFTCHLIISPALNVVGDVPDPCCLIFSACKRALPP